MFNIIPFTLRIEKYPRCHYFFVRISYGFGLKMKHTCLENVGMIKVAKNFTLQLNSELYTLEAHTLITEIKLIFWDKLLALFC
jgi:hypothetical protein